MSSPSAYSPAAINWYLVEPSISNMITFQSADKYVPPAAINWYITEVPPATRAPLKEISMVFSVTIINWKGVSW